MASIVLGISIGACVPKGQHEPDPGRSLQAAQALEESEPSVQHDPARIVAHEVAADHATPGVSSVPDGKRVIAASVRPGLIEFAEEMPKSGALWIGPLAGNGDRDVLVYVPPGSDPHADFRFVYHFHGTHSEHIQREAPGVPKKKWVGWNRLSQTLDAARELQEKRDDNVALVYPFSAGKRPEPGHKGWFNKEYDRIWMRAPESFDKLHDEVRAILRDELGVHASRMQGPVIAEGHSAGGLPLFHIAASGTTNVAEYIFLDASFQGWADGCWAAVKSAGASARVTLVITNRGIADPFGQRDPWCTTLETDAQTYGAAASGCRSGKRPAGSKKTCDELQAAATEWQDYAEWCTAMKNDMRDVDGVYVHRTKISHGAQPRHFTGGLELPESR